MLKCIVITIVKLITKVSPIKQLQSTDVCRHHFTNSNLLTSSNAFCGFNKAMWVSTPSYPRLCINVLDQKIHTNFNM